MSKTLNFDASDHQTFAPRVVAWQQTHGRHDLPWQNTQDPYKVWLSEIMLQQTQVTTVMGYFERFIRRFPGVSDLASAELDEVLGLWSGLGYYSRARNLHRAAQQVMSEHAGVMPRSAESLQTLPGIGRSTAAAIASLCFGERVAILDGNVKRVLTRYLGYDQDLAQSKNERALWSLAQDLLPQQQIAHAMPHYTQGVMDLGATVCSPRQPRCEVCPVRSGCAAAAQGDPGRYPVKTKKLKRSAESWWLLQARTSDGAVWLTRRPARGIWAHLYCLPMYESFDSLRDSVPACDRSQLQTGEVFKHVLTHKDLYLHPVQLQVTESTRWVTGEWVMADQWATLGLPAPVRKLLS